MCCVRTRHRLLIMVHPLVLLSPLLTRLRRASRSCRCWTNPVRTHLKPRVQAICAAWHARLRVACSDAALERTHAGTFDLLVYTDAASAVPSEWCARCRGTADCVTRMREMHPCSTASCAWCVYTGRKARRAWCLAQKLCGCAGSQRACTAWTRLSRTKRTTQQRLDEHAVMHVRLKIPEACCTCARRPRRHRDSSERAAKRVRCKPAFLRCVASMRLRLCLLSAAAAANGVPRSHVALPATHVTGSRQSHMLLACTAGAARR